MDYKGEGWQDSLLLFLAKSQAEDEEVTLQEFIDVCTIMSYGKFKFTATDEMVTDHLMHLQSEVSEVYEEWRAGHYMTETYWKNGKPEGIPVELADVILKTMAICGAYGVDIKKALSVKLLHNATKRKKKSERDRV